MPESKKLLFSFLAVGLLAGGFFFWQLGKNPLEKWDEAIHAQVTHEMLTSGNWLELTWNHEPYYRKPPLRFWLQGAVSGLVGENEFTIRFWSATAGVLTTLLIALWAWQALRKLPAVWFSVLGFLSGKYLFYHAFRTGETDGLLAFFTLLALWLYWQSWKKPKYIYWLALILGLTFLTKFSAAAFAGLAILLHLIFTKKFKSYSGRNWLIAAGVGLLSIAPWVIIQLIFRGQAFIQEYFQADIIERATTNLYGFVAGPDFYWEVFIKRFFPLACFAVPAILWSAWRGWKEKNQLLFLWLIFLVTTAAILTLNASKTNWYLLPLYPIIALVLGNWLSSWPSLTKRAWELLLIALGLSFFAYRLPSMIDATSSLRYFVPQNYLPQFLPKPGRWLWAIFLAGLFLAIYWLAKKHHFKKLWQAAIALVLLWLFGLGLGGQIAELRLKRSETLLPEIRAYLRHNNVSELYFYNIYLPHEPSVVYYLGNEKNSRLIPLDAPASAKPDSLVLEKILNKEKIIAGKAVMESPDFQLVEIK
ncbi:hypothetical protein C4546_04325 [Candidatus Parcubacteria bacterium]|jgi:4-amino-4-deoxy-L-arabinose transferase-like glycosyltransferase|nr:MAG: hypothetical protein C4546_04325 [Candidatus Parcubacteria bacterium]